MSQNLVDENFDGRTEMRLCLVGLLPCALGVGKRSHNGPKAIADWLKERQVKAIYIKPGSPWGNGHIESFHDKFRDECLNREIFGSLLEAKVLVEQWRMDSNTHNMSDSIHC